MFDVLVNDIILSIISLGFSDVDLIIFPGPRGTTLESVAATSIWISSSEVGSSDIASMAFFGVGLSR
jgi:hypothetical protein